ncbi:hypothetical protein IAU59_007199 [Kwoniella sp. CBS 9459]
MQLAYIIGMGPDIAPQIPLQAKEGFDGKLGGVASFDSLNPAASSGQPYAPALSSNTTAQPLLPWDQLFGPLPSRQSSPQGVFADLYNYGLDGNSSSEGPWDYFHLVDSTNNDTILDLPTNSFNL